MTPFTYLDDNAIIPINQIGFKKGARTSDHILVLKTLIDKYINRASKSYLYICFIDFQRHLIPFGVMLFYIS